MKRSAVSTGELKYLLLNNLTDDLSQTSFFKGEMLHTTTKDTVFTRQENYSIKLSSKKKTPSNL